MVTPTTRLLTIQPTTASGPRVQCSMCGPRTLLRRGSSGSSSPPPPAHEQRHGLLASSIHSCRRILAANPLYTHPDSCLILGSWRQVHLLDDLPMHWRSVREAPVCPASIRCHGAALQSSHGLQRKLYLSRSMPLRACVAVRPLYPTRCLHGEVSRIGSSRFRQGDTSVLRLPGSQPTEFRKDRVCRCSAPALSANLGETRNE